MAKELYNKHNGLWQTVIQEGNINATKRTVYYVADWDIHRIGKNIFTDNENDFSKIEDYMDLQIKDYYIIKKSRRQR